MPKAPCLQSISSWISLGVLTRRTGGRGRLRGVGDAGRAAGNRNPTELDQPAVLAPECDDAVIVLARDMQHDAARIRRHEPRRPPAGWHPLAGAHLARFGVQLHANRSPCCC